MAVERKRSKSESPEDVAKKRTKAKSEAKKSTKKASKKSASKKPDKATGPAASKTAEKPKRRAPRRRRGTPGESSTKTPAPTTRPVVRARARYVRSSARKARLVIEHIRGKSIDDARALLRHSPRAVAEDIGKLLDSAIANAENNHELVADDLLVKEVTADEGPTLRRFKPRAQGRATRIRKRTSHLSIALTTKD